MPQRFATNFICAKCNKSLTIQTGDTKQYTSIKCDCRILIIYPSGIISEIDRDKYKRNYAKSN